MRRKTDQSPAPTAPAANAAEIDAFLRRAAAIAPPPTAASGRLVFALDATMSRQPTWDLACSLQGAMFDAAASVGGLAVQLVYFRGLSETRASRWVGDARALGGLMGRIDCRGGRTQIAKVLAHVRREAEARPVAALAYVGDCMEEDVDALCATAGELGLLGVKAFMFHEGADAAAARAFREIARLTGGAYLPFDARAAAELRALLGAVAAYAAGGRRALEAQGGSAAARLLADLR
ncbi:MAG: VWA domain-containing protein [Rubrimonas sp.]|uniref:VWA domain-containing protein n=1 Tax=Rubrimonas sp. TaxID=2036015 RepID=UPI002FDDAC25